MASEVRRSFEFPCRSILAPPPKNQIAGALRGNQQSSRDQQMRHGNAKMNPRTHGREWACFLRSTSPMVEMVPPTKRSVTQSADVDGNFSLPDCFVFCCSSRLAVFSCGFDCGGGVFCATCVSGAGGSAGWV